MASIAVTRRGEEDSAENVDLPSDRLVLIADYVRAREAFGSDLEMSEVLGIDRTRLISWKKGVARPRQEHVRYLSDVATVVDALRRFLHPSVVKDWMTAPQLGLDDRTPVEVLREGRIADVLQAVNATEHGAYA